MAEPSSSAVPGPVVGSLPLARLRWLVALRWGAMVSVAVGGLVAALGAYPGVLWGALLGVSAIGLCYNAAVSLRLHRGDASAPWASAGFQAGFDFLALSATLWAAGGTASPFPVFYVFHVALFGVLGGVRAAMLAVLGAFALLGGLELLETVPALSPGSWRPASALFDHGARALAWMGTLGGVAYLVTHAMGDSQRRERALAAARDQVALDYEVLTNTLDELQAGLEIVDQDGRVTWRNRLAGRLSEPVPLGTVWRCPALGRTCAEAPCPVDTARVEHQPGRCRFAAAVDGDERVFEMLVFPLSLDTREPSGPSRVMNLYVDRTQATLAERALVQTERLVSFGRVAQGVAHELNTPLSTLQTLATDLRSAVRALDRSASAARDPEGEPHLDVPPGSLADLVESADAIQAETRRLGKVTQALLVGRDLLGPATGRPTTLGVLVERTKAVVGTDPDGGPRVAVEGDLDDLMLQGDGDALVQVLVNLLQNARDAMRGRAGGIRLVARRLDVGAEIAVEDEGPGIDPRIARRLFEPFATTKPPSQGTGLGLYASRKLVESMGGHLRVEARPGGGTRAIVTLPGGIVATAQGTLAPSGTLTQRERE